MTINENLLAGLDGVNTPHKRNPDRRQSGQMIFDSDLKPKIAKPKNFSRGSFMNHAARLRENISKEADRKNTEGDSLLSNG